MGTRSPLDRSAAHEALLYTSPEFPHAGLDRGSQIITEFLEAFYASDSKNMYDFATTWRPYLCALCGKASASAVQCTECSTDGQGGPAFRVEPGEQVRFIEQPEVRFAHELPPSDNPASLPAYDFDDGPGMKGYTRGLGSPRSRQARATTRDGKMGVDRG